MQSPSTRSVFARVLVAVSVVVCVGACGESDAVKSQWEARDKYSSCGSVELKQGAIFEEVAQPEIRCVREALKAGEGAELSVAAPTVEGDLIRSHYRLVPSGRLALYEDSTDDPYSDQKWKLTKCFAPDWLPEITCP